MSNIAGAVLRLTDSEAESLIVQFETDGGLQVTAPEVRLLERYFAEHPEAERLSERYEAALRKYSKK